MDKYEITLEMEGPDSENGHVSLSVFLSELKALSDSLREADRLLSKTGSPHSYYRVVGLSHSSPVSVTLGATLIKPDLVDTRSEVIRSYFGAFDCLEMSKPLPLWTSLKFIDYLKAFTKPVGGPVKAARLKAAELGARISENTASFIEELFPVAAAETCWGTVQGTIEGMSLRSRPRVFWVYPRIPAPKIKCLVSGNELEEKTIAAAKHYVEITGTIEYKKGSEHPTSIKASEIEILDDEPAESLLSLRGAWRGATGGVPPEEFIGRLRDEW